MEKSSKISDKIDRIAKGEKFMLLTNKLLRFFKSTKKFLKLDTNLSNLPEEYYWHNIKKQNWLDNIPDFDLWMLVERSNNHFHFTDEWFKILFKDWTPILIHSFIRTDPFNRTGFSVFEKDEIRVMWSQASELLDKIYDSLPRTPNSFLNVRDRFIWKWFDDQKQPWWNTSFIVLWWCCIIAWFVELNIDWENKHIFFISDFLKQYLEDKGIKI